MSNEQVKSEDAANASVAASVPTGGATRSGVQALKGALRGMSHAEGARAVQLHKGPGEGAPPIPSSAPAEESMRAPATQRRAIQRVTDEALTGRADARAQEGERVPVTEAQQAPVMAAAQRAPVMADHQVNPPSQVIVPRTAPAAELAINGASTDPCNVAVAQMGTGTPVEQNTAARIRAGTHRVAYIEDVPVHPDSAALITNMRLSPTQFSMRTDPWSGGLMAVQNNAVGFAIGSNLVGARASPVARWKTLLCHEVNHILHNDNGTDDASIERYKGEFRAYWIAEFAGVADLALRATQIRTHLIRTYASIRSRYKTDPAFAVLVDAHLAPAAGDNVTNA